MLSPHYNTAFKGPFTLFKTKEIVKQLMYIAAKCCLQTDTVPVMFSVRQPLSQHAPLLRIGLTSKFRISKLTSKFNILTNTNSAGLTLISLCHYFKADLSRIPQN
jgi:hypothetical protein